MSLPKPKKKKSWVSWAWDAFCITSLVGIWPRYIERKLIQISRHQLELDLWPKDAPPLHLVQLSDLHLNRHCTDQFLNRVLKKLRRLDPDVVVLTGDLLCYGDMKEARRLEAFLSQIPHRLGCYSILGNHDYEQYVSINRVGDYDLIVKSGSSIAGGFHRLRHPKIPTGRSTDRARAVNPHPELLALLERAKVQLLHNHTLQVGPLNLSGLGDYWAGKCLPAEAFQNYEAERPGVVLTHNPDSLSLIKDFPGDLILCGHTHGGQVNLPYICPRVMATENPHLKRGWATDQGKRLYINRGIGTVIPFRWFSVPEILSLTLKGTS